MALSDQVQNPTALRTRRRAVFSRVFAPLSSTTGKVQMVGLALLGLMIMLATFAPLIAPADPKALVCEPFAGPLPGHPLGCNDVGQDLLSQLLYGARISLFVGIAVATFSTLVATILALLAGYHAGSQDNAGSRNTTSWIDKIIMRCVDVALSLPFLPLVIVLGVYFGASIQTQILVISLVMWAHPVRELRAQILSIRAATYIEAARSMGANARFIGLRHILPELAPLIVPQFVRIAHNAILIEAALSFLGLGDPLQNSWGSILFHANARAAFLTGAWTYWIMPPGLAIGATVVSFALIGYGFDASLSPRTSRRSTSQAPDHAGVRTSVPVTDDVCLSIQRLSVTYPTASGTVEAVRTVSLDVKKGRLMGLVGESGSGKTSIALSILGLLRQPADVTSGHILLDGQDLLKVSERQLRALRASRIALIPQSAMNALNPVLTIGEQLCERLALCVEHSDIEQEQQAIAWLEQVGLKAQHMNAYAHELSGGMRQRAVIAIALCNKPDVVIADEPTTGLDVLVQDSIMTLLMRLRREFNLTILFVTHNLALIARHCDELAVMYHGEIVETGNPADLRDRAIHSHTRDLFVSLPSLSGEKRWKSLANDTDHQEPLLALDKVSKSFSPAHRALFSFSKESISAVEDISFKLHHGEVVGLVGGSGAGKSTIARLVMGSITPDSGDIRFAPSLLDGVLENQIQARELSRHIHMVYQDPYQSLNNRLTIANLVAEPLHIWGELETSEIRERVKQALALVRLPMDEDFLDRLPISLSGGQRQRVAFARAIITRPSIILADEPTSMLDQSVRLDVMDVMDKLRREMGTAFLFITHDIALARHFCDRLIVLEQGKIVEQGEAEGLLKAPTHPYTKALIAAT